MTVFNFTKQDNIAIIQCNDASQSQNVLNRSVSDEFDAILTELETDSAIKGMVLSSTKKDCFIAGADIAMIDAAASYEEAKALSELLQEITVRISKLPYVTVAAIDGVCLGGGLELALAFDYRIASTRPSTRLGLPEVQLGLLPGGSGTQRLPRLIALPAALDLILTGKQIDSKRAYKMGLVDEIVAPELLIAVAEKYLSKDKSKSKAKRDVTFKQRLFFDNPISRKFILSQARKQTLSATKGNYPAPLKILDVIEQGLSVDLKSGLAHEAQGFAELAMTDESKQLIQLFFASTDIKKETGVASADVKAKPVTKVGVLGAGLMGAGIAYVTIKAGLDVRLKDIRNDSLAKGVGYIGKILDKKVARRHMTGLARNNVMNKLTATTDYSGFAQSQVVIEAVFEDLALKQGMINDIEALGNDIVFATNTSALPIDDIAAQAKHPENVIGMHYFSPVEKMPLLEVIRGTKTADWVVATAVELGKQQGKTVIVVNDGPGFYTTRILVPYVMEAIRLIQEGVSIAAIDTALEQFGFPVGPIKLMDEVGIDVGSHIVTTLNEAFGDRVPLIDSMEAVLADDRKGRKNNKGFYCYHSTKGKGKGKASKVDETIYPLLGVNEPGSLTLSNKEIVNRCLFVMLNEAQYCLSEGILANARDGDIGAIFGLGFPPFLGGPFQYIKTLGQEAFVAQLQQYEGQHGARYRPVSN